MENEFVNSGALTVAIGERNQSRANILANLAPCRIWIANDTAELIFTDKDGIAYFAGVVRKPAAAWSLANGILGAGECGFETDTGRLKIGDGSAAWSDLNYLSSSSANLSENTVAALSGTCGRPSADNKFVTDSDPRNANARTPTEHASSHKTGQSDALSATDIGGVAEDDSRLSDARTPTAHAETHAADGSDPITKGIIGLDKVDNTSDANKPVSTLQQAALDLKESVGNKVTSIDGSSTDQQYPSAKLLYDKVVALTDLINHLLNSNGVLQYQGAIDCAGNPDYPAATIGWTWKVSSIGKVGGANGTRVQVGDLITCIENSSGGSQGDAGAQFNIVQTNLDGAVIGPESSCDNHIALFDGPCGKLLKDGGQLGTAAFHATEDFLRGWTADIFASGDAVYSVANSGITSAMVIEVVPQSTSAGKWAVTSGDGFFQIQSEAIETSPITFFWQIRG